MTISKHFLKQKTKQRRKRLSVVSRVAQWLVRRLPSPALSVRVSLGPSSSQFPMLQAVLVTESGDEGAFLDRLKTSAWNLNVASASTAVQAVQQCRPILVIMDNKLSDLTALSKSVLFHIFHKNGEIPAHVLFFQISIKFLAFFTIK